MSGTRNKLSSRRHRSGFYFVFIRELMCFLYSRGRCVRSTYNLCMEISNAAWTIISMLSMHVRVFCLYVRCTLIDGDMGVANMYTECSGSKLWAYLWEEACGLTSFSSFSAISLINDVANVSICKSNQTRPSITLTNNWKSKPPRKFRHSTCTCHWHMTYLYAAIVASHTGSLCSTRN